MMRSPEGSTQPGNGRFADFDPVTIGAQYRRSGEEWVRAPETILGTVMPSHSSDPSKINIMPSIPLPHGAEYATLHPRMFSEDTFSCIVDGEMLEMRYVIEPLSPQN